MTLKPKLEAVKKKLEEHLAGKVSNPAIRVYYLNEKGEILDQIGFLHEISETHVIISPYSKNLTTTTTPADYYGSKRKIPLDQIIKFYKIPDVFKKRSKK